MPSSTPIWRRRNAVVKMEMFQPGASHKARSARHIVRDAIDKGKLEPGGRIRILEKTGGNLGVGLALEGQRFGIEVDLVIGHSFSRTKRALCKRYGARVVGDELLRRGWTPAQVVDELLEDEGQTYYFTDQFNNEANLRAHVLETGPEFAEQISGIARVNRPIHLVIGAGTGASFQGIAMGLKEKFQRVRCTLVMPAGCDVGTETYVDHSLEGFAVGVRPPFLDISLIDSVRSITNAQARKGQDAMARELGFFPGMSSGANYAAARLVAEENPDAIVATAAYDNGESYIKSEAGKSDDREDVHLPASQPCM